MVLLAALLLSTASLATAKVPLLNSSSSKELWSFPVINGGTPILNSKQNILFFTGADMKTNVNHGTMYALDALSGQVLWSLDSGDMVYSKPTLNEAEDTVYFGSYNKKLYALNAQTGATRWVFVASDKGSPTGAAFRGCQPIVHGGAVFAHSWNGLVYSLQADTGKMNWQFDSHWPPSGFSLALFADASLLYVAGGEYLFALDAASGALRWKYLLPQGSRGKGSTIQGRPAVAQAGTVCVAHSGTGIDVQPGLKGIDGETGALLWEVTTSSWPPRGGPTLSSDGGVAFAALENSVWALNTTSGTKIWASPNTKEKISSETVIGPNRGTVFVGTLDEHIVGFATQTGAQASDYQPPWFKQKSKITTGEVTDTHAFYVTSGVTLQTDLLHCISL